MISIVIPVFNQQEMTRACIEAIRENTQTGSYEIIIIDNGSNPPIEAPAKIVRNEENKGFPAAINQGIRFASGDVIILLNNDCIMTPGWADKLVSYLDQYSIIGPVTNYCAGLQRVVIPTYHDDKGLYQAATQWGNEHAGQSLEVNWIIGFCMAFKKSLYDEVGPFDESLWPCSGEEVDFCLRAKQKAYSIGIARDVYIHHEGSQTFQSMDVNYNEICERNDKHLVEKWGKYAHQQEIDIIPESGIRLNLGCGLKETHMKEAINIDKLESAQPDLLCDITNGLPFEDNSVDVVFAMDFIEHLERHEVLRLMDEIYRVLKKGGVFFHRTPDDGGRGAWQDPTHKSAWNINTWRYYFTDSPYRSLYGIKAHFLIKELHNEWTDLENKVLHTFCTYEAIKE